MNNSRKRPLLPDPVPTHEKVQGRRLLELKREIATAEMVLRALHLAIKDARSQQGLETLQNALVENEQLKEQISTAAHEASVANAAMTEAIEASRTDPLTSLPNRVVLLDRLASELAACRRHETSLAIFFVDLDGFKNINDQFGHGVGDLLLQHIAGCLTCAVRECDTVCRLGGDEFVLLASDIHPADVEAIAHKLALAVSTPFFHESHIIAAGASVGASTYPHDGSESRALLRAADLAMYRAKSMRFDNRKSASPADF